MSKLSSSIKNSRIGSWFNKTFKGFGTLIIMQLKEQLSFSFKADKKGTLTKLILGLVGFGAITAVIYIVINVLGALGILGANILPVPLFNIFLYLIFILNTLSCIHRMTKSLYFSKDNQVLLTYPVNNGTIFLSKIVTYYILELVKNFLMLAPLLLAYGIVNGFAFYYYPWMIFVFLIISMLPVSIAGVLSIPYMYVLSFLKKSQYLQSILTIAALVTGAVFIFILLSKIPADLKISTKWSTIYYPKVIGVAQQIEVYVGPLVYISAIFLGYRGFTLNSNPRSLSIINARSPIILLVILGIIIVANVIAYLIARPLFFKMASKPFEYHKKLIDHNYKMNINKAELHNRAFRPILKYPISKKDKIGIVNKLSRLLRVVNKEEKLFLLRKIDTKRILRFLNKYVKDLKFEEVDLNEITDFGYVIQIRREVPFLVLIKGIKGDTADCYDPYHLKAKNFKSNSFLSIFVKDVLTDIRTPGTIVSNFLLFIITPLAIAGLNAIFRAINASFQGQSFTVAFNILIIMLITLSSNVSMASIYSREGNASYMLKAAPVNYLLTLTSKLVIRAFIVVASLLATCIIYHYYSPITYLRPDLLFLTFTLAYLAHLTWSAELDFMNPQDRLYQEVGVNVNNPNEIISAVLTFIIAGIYTGVGYFLVTTELSLSFIKLLIISAAFFIIRVGLFYLKIYAYGTSRSEERRN